MAVIAVTGATGFVGRAVIAELLGRGFRVRALVRNADALPGQSGLETVTGDLSKATALVELVAGTDGVLHCAGAVKALSTAAFHQVNAEGTLAVVEAMRATGIERLVLVSSLVARRPEVSPYAASKRAAEAHVASSGLAASIVRPPAVYGPGDAATLPLFKQAERGILALPVPRNQRFSVIYVTDLAALLASLVIEGRRHDPEVIECADGQEGGYSWQDFTAAAAAAVGRKVRFLPLPGALLWPAAVAAQAAARLRGRAEILSPDKLRELSQQEWMSDPGVQRTLEESLGWRPLVGLREGLAASRLWYRERALL